MYFKKFSISDEILLGEWYIVEKKDSRFYAGRFDFRHGGRLMFCSTDVVFPITKILNITKITKNTKGNKSIKPNECLY